MFAPMQMTGEYLTNYIRQSYKQDKDCLVSLMELVHLSLDRLEKVATGKAKIEGVTPNLNYVE